MVGHDIKKMLLRLKRIVFVKAKIDAQVFDGEKGCGHKCCHKVVILSATKDHVAKHQALDKQTRALIGLPNRNW